MLRVLRLALSSAVALTLTLTINATVPAAAMEVGAEPQVRDSSAPLPRTAVTPRVTSGRWFTIAHRDIAGAHRRPGTLGRQSLIRITDVRARQRFLFDVALPAGARLRAHGEGLEAVDREGAVIGALEAPWAVDAIGIAVSTRFEVVDRNSFVQVVEHRAVGATYPVFADPWWVVPVALRVGGQILGRYVVRRATYEAAKRAAAKLAAKQAQLDLDDVEPRTPRKLLKLNRRNFRENVRRRTGWEKSSIVGYDAHHTLPVKFNADFSRAGLNIHNPIFGHWWCSPAHRKYARKFNRLWEDWLAPRRSDIEDSRYWRIKIENKRIRMVSRSWHTTYQCPSSRTRWLGTP